MKSSKPRPVSMMIPRNDTFGAIDEPAKAAEAPEPRAAREASTFEVVGRPRVARALTPSPSVPRAETPQETYAKAPYADVPKVKARVLNFGDALFTDAHQKQVKAFRDECVRLSGYNAHLKTKLASAAERTEAAESECRELKNELMALKMETTQLRLDHYGTIADLKQANDTLAEVESVFAHLRTRPTRRFSVDRPDDGASEHGYQLEMPVRPKSPTPNAGRSL